MKRKTRVGVIARYFPNYRNAVFRLLSRHPDLEFEFISGRAPEELFIREGTVEGIKRRFIRVFRVGIPWTSNGVSWRCGTISSSLMRRYDVLVLTNDILAPDVWLTALISRLTGVPVCLWGQGMSRPATPLRDTLRRQLTRLAHAAVYYSEGGRRYWIERGIPAEKLFVAYNALDTEQQTKVREALAPAQLESFLQSQGLAGKKLVTCLGRLVAVKQPDVMIRAVAAALPKEPELVGIFVGDGPLRRELELLAADLGVAERIRFIGESYDEALLARYLVSSRGVLLPAAAGLAIQHAAVYGAPLILGDRPGHHLPEQEIVQEGRTGLWCPEGDIDAFAAAIVRLCRDDPFRDLLSENLRREVHDRYNTERMAQGFTDAINYCLGQSRGPGGGEG